MASSICSDQEKSNASNTKKVNVKGDHKVNPEEKNCQGAGHRLTEEMLEYYYQQSKEEERWKRKYEEAAYRVYGTVPSGVEPDNFHEKMAELLKKRNKESSRNCPQQD